MMKFLIPVLVLALAVTSNSEVTKSSRNNLVVGHIRPGDRLLHSQQVSQPAQPNAIQTQDFVYNAHPNVRISAISVIEGGVRQSPSARFIRGGIGSNSVTIRMQSMRGRGFLYNIQIWGQ